MLRFIYLKMRPHPASCAKLLLAAGVSASVPCGLKPFSPDTAQPTLIVLIIVLRLAVCGTWPILLWIEDDDRLAFRKLRTYRYKTA